jgi:hypothetical protein
MKKQFFVFLMISLLPASCFIQVNEVEGGDTDPRITYFAFEKLTPPVEGIIDDEARVIKAYVPIGADLENLEPTIRTSPGCELENLPGKDFSQPVCLTVSAGERKAPYTINVYETTASGTVWQVGKDKPYKTLAAVAAVATDHSTVEVDAGLYSGDVTQWTQHNLILRAVGGEVVLDANGKNYRGLGIWEIKGGRITVEGFTFKNAKVADRNGAGIRLTQGHLTLINCRFLNNENGVLTANDGVSTLTVRNCEFGYNGYGDGSSHNLYAGYIAGLSVTGSYFHHANVGHLLKSRAAVSRIAYNRLSDENDTQSKASYELDFPSGGRAFVTGNIIQQSARTENPILISFAKEGFDRYPQNELYLSYNTLVNERTQNALLVNAPVSTSIRIAAYNNLSSENTYFDSGIKLQADRGNSKFRQGELNGDYSPTPEARKARLNQVETEIDPSLIPVREYKHPLETQALAGPPAIPGALQ